MSICSNFFPQCECLLNCLMTVSLVWPLVSQTFEMTRWVYLEGNIFCQLTSWSSVPTQPVKSLQRCHVLYLDKLMLRRTWLWSSPDTFHTHQNGQYKIMAVSRSSLSNIKETPPLIFNLHSCVYLLGYQLCYAVDKARCWRYSQEGTVFPFSWYLHGVGLSDMIKAGCHQSSQNIHLGLGRSCPPIMLQTGNPFWTR
jgi:hypothetical protein